MKIPKQLQTPEMSSLEPIKFKPLIPEIKMIVHDKGTKFNDMINERLREGWKIRELHFPVVSTSYESKVFYIAVLERLVEEDESESN